MAGLERSGNAEEEEFERRLQLGQHMEVIAGLRESVEAEPLRERRSLQLMLALFRCGRQLDALREFHRLREALSEVGLETSAEAIALERAILLNRPELDWIGPNTTA
jgi:DNA-binding SARP family transcriptional activator